MYSRDAASQLKQQFWTNFGQYIAPHRSADGLKVNWVNYKTGIKYLFFKMDADKHKAFIAIEIAHPDKDIQEMMFEQFKAYKNILESSTGEVWNWALHFEDASPVYAGEGRVTSRIYKELQGVSVFKPEDWPALISFFKPRIIALDEFWSTAQYGFDLFK